MDERLATGYRGEVRALVDLGIGLRSGRLVRLGIVLRLGRHRFPAAVGRLAPARIRIRDLLGVLLGDCLAGILGLSCGLLGRALLGRGRLLAGFVLGR